MIGVETRAPLGESERGSSSANSTGLPNTGALGPDVATLMVFKRRVDGDGLGRLLLVSSIQESLRDNEIRSVSDLASSARRFKYCQHVWLGPTRRYPPQALGLTAGNCGTG